MSEGSNPITRFLFDSGHYAETTLRVKPRAVHPGPDHKTSVFRVAGLDDDAIWELGDVEVASRRQKPLKVRAEFQVRDLTELNLRLEDDSPPPRHANIVDWPSEKSAWMKTALELAAKATLQIRPVSPA